MNSLLEAFLYGDVTRSYYDMYAGYENTSYARIRDVGGENVGSDDPRPVKTGYRGYDWSDAGETYYFEDGGWVNCLDGSVWEGK